MCKLERFQGSFEYKVEVVLRNESSKYWDSKIPRLAPGIETFDAVAGAISLLILAGQGFAYLSKTEKEDKKVGPHLADIKRDCTRLFFIIDQRNKS